MIHKAFSRRGRRSDRKSLVGEVEVGLASSFLGICREFGYSFFPLFLSKNVSIFKIVPTLQCSRVDDSDPLASAVSSLRIDKKIILKNGCQIPSFPSDRSSSRMQLLQIPHVDLANF